MLPGIRMYSSGAHLRDCPKKIHHLNFMIMFLVYVTASHKWGGGQAAIASTPHAVGAANLFKCRFKCQKAMKKADTVKPPPRCLAPYTTHGLFPFHQRPLIIPSTDSPKAVPAAALLNAHRNISTAYTLGNDGMEAIMGWRKDWWGNPCSSCMNLQWPLNYQAAVPMFPWADFFPI